MGEQEERYKGMTTACHSQYWAHALTLQGATGTIEARSRSIAGVGGSQREQNMKYVQDPNKQVGYLQQYLSSDKKPLNLFLYGVRRFV